jgi:hypothetical protein
LAASANAAITIQASAVPFIDISVSGTSVGAISDDSEFNVTATGFAGNGLLAGNLLRVGNNGGVIWNPGTATDVGYINASQFGGSPLATMAAANTTDKGNGNGTAQFLAVLWDDNTPLNATSSCKWQVIGGDLIVQWSNEDHFAASGTGTVTYEMIVHGGVSIASGASLVDFVYQDTLYSANQYQNDGGSATIGYKNWGVNAGANDVEYGTGGGTNINGEAAFNDPSMQPKIGGWASSANGNLTHSVSIVPAPSSLALLGLGGLLAGRRRRN